MAGSCPTVTWDVNEDDLKHKPSLGRRRGRTDYETRPHVDGKNTVMGSYWRDHWRHRELTQKHRARRLSPTTGQGGFWREKKPHVLCADGRTSTTTTWMGLGILILVRCRRPNEWQEDTKNITNCTKTPHKHKDPLSSPPHDVKTNRHRIETEGISRRGWGLCGS